MIRADILGGRLRPGDKLPFAALAQRYGASFGVLREGLSHLVAEGLVTSEPQFGFRVMTLSMKDLEDLTATRCHIEGLALRYSIEHGDLAWEASVVAAHHQLEHTPGGTPEDSPAAKDQWADAHAAFHRSLLAACSNERLKSIAISLRDSAEVYRRWSTSSGLRGRDIPGEHRRILDALLQRDADEGVAALTEHLRTTQVMLLTDTIEPLERTDPNTVDHEDLIRPSA